MVAAASRTGPSQWWRVAGRGETGAAAAMGSGLQNTATAVAASRTNGGERRASGEAAAAAAMGGGLQSTATAVAAASRISDGEWRAGGEAVVAAATGSGPQITATVAAASRSGPQQRWGPADLREAEAVATSPQGKPADEPQEGRSGDSGPQGKPAGREKATGPQNRRHPPTNPLTGRKRKFDKLSNARPKVGFTTMKRSAGLKGRDGGVESLAWPNYEPIIPITITEVTNAADNLKNIKTPGLNDLPANFWKLQELQDTEITWLTEC
ncbi:hypothetical protein JRQ81_019020 [Phrynocephalus forsythii]|uniref:Uncharacterized protein n=1 Tax=Phrynocephalus forsythii TaxID=171643 RepID=A0A9Q0XPM9_9SAUR|nr:hypothetical protein JRQ81_019020 [Phrynocephalus forsythii]